MRNLVKKGKVLWNKIYSNTSQSTLYYVVPEKDELIFEMAEKHMQTYAANRNFVIIYTEDKLIPKIGQAEYVKLTASQMECLLIYLRTCRDALLNLSFDNVFVLSFIEVGGNSLQRLYEENIYEDKFLISQWLLLDVDKPDKWRS